MFESRIAALLSRKNVTIIASQLSNRTGSPFIKTDKPLMVNSNCWNATVNVTSDRFEITARPPNTLGADHVIIGNAPEWSAVGQVLGKGIIYSEDFSGCIFFLFRDPHGSVYGVHSYRSNGKYPDPTPYFNRLGAKLIYVFPTTGKFKPGNFGTVIANVGTDDITIDFLETRERKLVGVADHTVIAGWRAAPAILADKLGDVLKFEAWDDYPVSPKKAGRRHRVANYLLGYM
jgi:hypothetical protein